MEGTSQFYVHIGLFVVRKILGVVHRHSGDECFPQQFSLGGILEGYSDFTLGGIRGKQGFNGEELDVNQGCPSGLPLVHPHPVSVVEPGGASVTPVKSVYTPM